MMFLGGLLLRTLAWADPAGQGQDAMMANSPFTAYTSHVVGYVLVAAFLVITLLVGGFLVVNLSLMSKRSIDKDLGGQEPSDVGILKGERFDQGNIRRILPSEEDEDQLIDDLPRHQYDPRTMLREEDMAPDFWPKKKAG